MGTGKPENSKAILVRTTEELHRKVGILARVSGASSSSAYCEQAIRERVNQEWPVLAPMIEQWQAEQAEQAQKKEA